MIFHLFRRPPREESIASLYGMIVAQARTPAFYQAYGVPDTLNGRFEMVVLHGILVLRRLNALAEPGRRMGQAVFDMFCQDMDDSLREMGVGDLGVPREMRRIAEAFYGRRAAYDAALGAAGPQPLVAALARNVFGSASGVPTAAERLAAYTREALRRLESQDEAALCRGEFAFPDPNLVPANDAMAAEVTR
jgi:cytochrome b pre-mRNA-processing protein 3